MAGAYEQRQRSALTCWPVIRALTRGRAQLRLAHGLDVELGGPVEPVDAVALLHEVGELGVAVAEHLRVVEQDIDQPGEALDELLGRAGPFAVSFRALSPWSAWRAPP